MNPEQEIYLSCNACDETHRYQYADAEYNAIEVEWKSPQEDVHLLEIPPSLGEKYLVHLHPPLALNTSDPFWAVYLNPNASLNGIETEKDLEDIRFCKCDTEHIIESNRERALLAVRVLEVKGIDDLKTEHKPNVRWSSLLEEGDAWDQYGSTMNFRHYSYLDVNIQSDLGISAIVKKEDHYSYILAINQWDFHLNEWILCRIPLSREEEKRYGIR